MRSMLCAALLGLGFLANAEAARQLAAAPASGLASAPSVVTVYLSPASAPKELQVVKVESDDVDDLGIQDYELSDVPNSEAKDKKTIPIVTLDLPEVTKDKLDKKLNITKPSVDVEYVQISAPPPPPSKLEKKKDLVKDIKNALAPAVKEVKVVKVESPSPAVAISGAPVTVSGVPVVEAPPPKFIPVIEKVIKVPELLPEPVLNITVPKLALAPKAILVPDLNQTVDSGVVSKAAAPVIAVLGPAVAKVTVDAPAPAHKANLVTITRAIAN